MSSTSSRIDVEPVSLEAILGMREEYRREMACQIVHDSWHERRFTTPYILRLDGLPIGYGAVGGAPREPRHTIKEYYLLPKFRGFALHSFRRLIVASGARRIEAQTNDTMLLLMLLDSSTELSSHTVLFADGLSTRLTPGGAVFRPLADAELPRVFPHTHEPVGEYALEVDGMIAATGGIATHYNPPYGDLYMEVAAPYQRRGLGSYLIQELKRVCYEAGRIPAARCDHDNVASRLTLQRAGMFPCGRIVEGHIAG